MATVSSQTQISPVPPFPHSTLERRSCCGRFCEITYTFLSSLCAAIVAIFLKIFGSERSPEQPPVMADLYLTSSQGLQANSIAEGPPSSTKDLTIEDRLKKALAILSNPSASLDELNAADAMLDPALQLQTDDEAWEKQWQETNQRLHEKMPEQSPIDIFPGLIAVDAEPLDVSITADECLANACKIINKKEPSASQEELLLAKNLLARAVRCRNLIKVKVQEAHGTILYRRYLLDPQKQAADLDLAINSFKLVRGSSDSGLALQTLARLLFARWQLYHEEDDLKESKAIYQKAISKLPRDKQPEAHLELGDVYTLSANSHGDFTKARIEYQAALPKDKNQDTVFHTKVQLKIDIADHFEENDDLAVATNTKVNDLLTNVTNILQNENRTFEEINKAIAVLRVALEFKISDELHEQIEKTMEEAEKLLFLFE